MVESKPKSGDDIGLPQLPKEALHPSLHPGDKRTSAEGVVSVKTRFPI